MSNDRDWREVLSGASQLPRDWLDTAQRWHRNFLLKILPVILLILVLGVGLNAAGWKEVNFLFALATILGGVFFATQPKVVLTVFGVGTLWNGLLDSKVTGAKANLDQGLQFVGDKYVRPVGHVLLLSTVIFVFLGTYRIQNPAAMLPLIVVVMGLGLWAALFASDASWYRRITLKLLLASGVAAVIGAYFYTPSHTEKVAEEVRKMSETNLDERNAGQIEALKKFVADGGVLSPEQQALLTKRTSEAKGTPFVTKMKATLSEIKGEIVIPISIPKDITHTKPLCGIPAGQYSWQIRGDPYFELHHQLGIQYVSLFGKGLHSGDIRLPFPTYHSFGLLLNGTPNGGRVTVENDTECAIVPTFNLIAELEPEFHSGRFWVRPTIIQVVLTPE